MNAAHIEPGNDPLVIQGTNETPRPDTSQRWSLAANAGAIFSAFVASACCVGPLVLALLGIGGGALLAKVETYRPYFTAVTLGLLAFGFWIQYRKPKPVANADGISCDCPTLRANKAGRVMLWVATALVIGLLALPHIAPLIWS